MRKTSAMVEAGILAAIAIVMALITIYVPVIGAFVNFVWPLPIIICGIRHGLKWSVLSLIVAGILIAMIISPMQAFFLAAIFGILGLILGECMRRHLPPGTLMFYGTLGGILALVINIVLSFLVMGIDPIEMIFTSFGDSLVQVAEFQRSHGISEEDIQKSVASYQEMLRMMKIIMPAAFLLSAPIIAFVNIWAAKKVMGRLGESFEDFPSFKLIQLPWPVLGLYFVSLAGVTYYYLNNPESWLYTMFVNIQTLCSFLLVLQGVILVYWAADHYKKPKWWANVAVTLIFFIPLMSQIMVYVGAFDFVVDFRKIRKLEHKKWF